MLRKFRTHFVSGLIVLAPLFLTFVVMGYLIRLVDRLLVNPLFQVLPVADVDAGFKVFLAKLAIALFVALFVAGIGFVAEKIMFKQFTAAGEGLLKNIPVFNKIYGSIQEIAQAFFGDKRGVFKQVVFVEYPRKGVYAIGFVTQDKKWEVQRRTGKDLITVFVPSPPNPATGFFVFVEKSEIVESDLTIEEGIKLVISGGAAVPS